MALTKVQTALTNLGVINVLDYGAVGDGTTDDTTALQAALNAVSTTGETVFFPAGTYLLDTTTPLFVKSNTWVKGAGIGATTILHPKSHAFRNETYASGGPNTDITISDMTFDANNLWVGAVIMSGVSRVIVERIHVYNDYTATTGNAIAFASSASQDCEDLKVANCILDTIDYGVNLDATLGTIRRVAIANNSITPGWGSGIATQRHVEGVTITGNSIVLPCTAVNALTGGYSGLGIKLVDGDSLTVCARNIVISGNEFYSPTTLTAAIGHVWQYDDSGTSYVDETTNANSATAADWQLFPASAIANDAAYFGAAAPFDQLRFDYVGGTAGVGGTVAWEYWDGATWTAVGATLVDGTDGFTRAVGDEMYVQWSGPTDWAASVINGSSSLYWLRARVTGTYSTNPVMDQGYTKLSPGAISAAGFANTISVTGNTFRGLGYAISNNFAGTGAKNISFCNNVVADCGAGYRANNSTDAGPTISGNTFESCSQGIVSSLRDSVVSGNKFLTITNEAIRAESPAEHAAFTSNVFKNIGREGIKLVGTSGFNDGVVISGNSFFNCCSSIDATFSVIQLNNNAHTIVGNSIVSESTSIKPIYCVADLGAANWRIMTGNWMYGGRTDYMQTTGANDVGVNNATANVERGGIS
jgi:hypothetical protein